MHRPAQRNMPLKRRAGRAVSRGRELFPTRLCGRGKIFLAQLPLFLLDWGEEGIMVESTAILCGWGFIGQVYRKEKQEFI